MAKKGSKRKRKNAFIRSLLVTVFLLVIIGVIAFAGVKLAGVIKGTQTAKTVDTETEKEESRLVTIDGMDTAHYTQKAMKNALLEKYPWSMSIQLGEDETEVPNALESEIDKLIETAYGSEQSEDFELSFDEASAKAMAAKAAADFADSYSTHAPASNAMSFDEANNEFVFNNAASVKVIDKEKLTDMIAQMLLAGDYTSQIACPMKEENSNHQAGEFGVIGTYVTHTTANADRNTNVSNACKTINGLILQPGEQFSYNGVLGRRTEEKGYKPAGAYSNGEHVMELGGGVCQVSSTIYNAVIAANLQVDARTGHTYEPTYVTPGNDATVSYEQPDFKFTNSTDAPVGLKVSFADRTVTVQIYGIPQLEPGVKRYLKSEKMTDLEPPMPAYIEDPTIVPGFEVMDKNAKCGSKWETKVVLEKDGEIIEEEYLHTTTYKGEPATIRRNTMGGTIAPEQIQQVDTATGQIVTPPPAESAPAQNTAAEHTSAQGEDGGEAP